MGSNPTGPGNSTDESTEDTPDQTTDTTLDEYDSEESTPVSPPAEEGSSAAGGAAGAAGTAGAAGAAGGAGGSAGVAGGAPATGTTEGSDEEPTGAPGGEVTEPETPEEDESEEEADDTSRETSEPDEPPEHEPAEPEPEDTEEFEQEESDEDDEEPEVEDADVLIRTDPWDTTGWGNEPDIRELQETYGPMVSVSYEVLPPRRLEDWDTAISMPVTNDPEIPNDTTASYRALTASKQQGLFRPYLRRLRIAALCEGRNVEKESTLLELSDEVGLDPDQLREDMENVDAGEATYIEEVPQMDVTIGDLEHDWTKNVEFGRMHARMLGEGVKPLPIHRPLAEFVSEYEPVTTQEVDQALDILPSELASNSRIGPADYEGGEFWRVR